MATPLKDFKVLKTIPTSDPHVFYLELEDENGQIFPVVEATVDAVKSITEENFIFGHLIGDGPNYAFLAGGRG